jgi:hypothetical protein
VTTNFPMLKFAFYFILFFLIVFLPQQAISQEKKYTLQVEEETIKFTGLLYVEQVEKISELIKTEKYKSLVIQSGGGDIVAAMKLGEVIFDNELNIIVNNYCISSCANYIFPAGKKKIINENSIVVWHGDARQKNFKRELIDLENKIASNGAAMSEKDVKRLQYRRLSIKMQDDFYLKIGIDGSLARIGQEMANVEKRVNLWTIPVDLMHVFGIRNIDAPKNYGSVEYCEKWMKKFRLSNPPSCLLLSDDDLVNWKNRLDK